MVNFKLFKSLSSFSKKPEPNLAKVNLVFIVIFLNIWDFVVNREFLNGMVLGILMFGPAAFFWVVDSIRATALVTLISILEFIMLLILVIEGFEISGTGAGVKSIFWVPYLLMAGTNGFWGLKIYSEYRERKK